MDAKQAKRLAGLERTLRQQLEFLGRMLAGDAERRLEHGAETADKVLRSARGRVKAAETRLAKAREVCP